MDNHQHADTKAKRLQTVHSTPDLEIQLPRRPSDSLAEQDDKHLNVALLLTERYGMVWTDPWLVAVAEKKELLQGSQEVADQPPRSPNQVPWTLVTLGLRKRVVLQCQEPEPIDHP